MQPAGLMKLMSGLSPQALSVAKLAPPGLAKNSRGSCLGGTASSAVPPVLRYAPSDILLCCGPTDSAARTESTECSQPVLRMNMSRTQHFSTSMIMSKISARGALQVDGCAGGHAPQALFGGQTGPPGPAKNPRASRLGGTASFAVPPVHCNAAYLGSRFT